LKFSGFIFVFLLKCILCILYYLFDDRKINLCWGSYNHQETLEYEDFMKTNFNKRRSFAQRGPNGMIVLMLVLVGFIGYLFWYNSENRQVEQVSYSVFLNLVESGNVQAVTIRDQEVQGKLRNGNQFKTTVLPNEHLWEFLRRHNVVMQVHPPEKQTWGGYMFLMIMLSLLLFGLFYARHSQSGGGGASRIFSVGKSKAKFFSPNTITVTFKDVAGTHDGKEDLKDVIEFLKTPEKFERLGAKIPRGVLLSGAPGNGKTLLAKAVAGEASCPFFSVSGSDFVEVFVGVGASRVRDLFVQAQKNAPCIVFIDEIDAVGRQRGVGLGGGNDEREQTLNQLLSEMDGFATEHGSVIILAATNRPDVLDKALLRPGRFDRVIEVPYPDLQSRKEILEVHAEKVKLSPNVDLGRVARGTPGFSGADLKNLINEAALVASKANKEYVEIEDFEHSRNKLLLGAERKTMFISEKEKKRTACHESGHTLLNVLLPETDPFHKVTIIPRGRALGASWSLPECDRYSDSKSAMLSRIVVCLGGFISEKLMFNEQTSGAADDIDKATKIAKAMVCRFGMSDLGPIVFGKTDEHPFLGGTKHTPDYSEETAQKIDKEVEKIVSSSYKKGEKLLTENRDKLEILATTLLEKETLQASEVYELLGIKPRETHSLSE
jgi:cell division protease FtsH